MFLISCTKKEVSTVSFNVTTTSTTFNVGDSVVFTMAGNPDYIVFYSGETGSKYENRNRDTAFGTPTLSFLSAALNGSDTGTLHLMLSTNFSGIYDSSHVKNANWTDITNLVKLPTKNNDTLFSGNISLFDFIHKDTPIYVAFKYADQQNGITSQRTWLIQNLVLKNILQDSTSTTLLDLPNSVWLGVNMLNSAAIWSISTTAFKISGGNATAPSNEDWLVSQPINLTRVTPDVGTSIKTFTDPILKSYYHVFKKPGTYSIVFDAINANSNGSQETLRTINITVK